MIHQIKKSAQVSRHFSIATYSTHLPAIGASWRMLSMKPLPGEEIVSKPITSLLSVVRVFETSEVVT